MKKSFVLFFISLLLTCFYALPTSQLLATEASALTAEEQLAENILRELIGFESTAERPQEIRKALQSMAERLLNAGFPQGDIQLVSAATGHYGLVALPVNGRCWFLPTSM